MAESCDARRGASGSPMDATSADALYERGIVYYRQRQWQRAWETFQDLRAIDSGRRGIDALLDELEIFIRLESFASDASSDDTPSSFHPDAIAAAQVAAAPAERPRATWVGSALAGAVVVALFVYGVINPHLSRRMAQLREAGQAHAAAQEWSEAINAYEELLLLSPSDAEVRDDLWTAYYERGDGRSAGAHDLEDMGLYQEASQQWEKAAADFRAAQQVSPDHSADPRGEPALRIAVADERKRCTARFARARQLRAERRWTEAIQTLLLLRGDTPDYRRQEVLVYLSETCLEGGLAAVARAESAAGVREGVAMIEQASEIHPASYTVQTALRRARVYYQAAVSYESHRWDVAIPALEALLSEVPGYADGHGRQLLCSAYLQRGGEQHDAGDLRLALADYEAAAGLECGQAAEVEARLREIAMALTPTATPTPLPTAIPLDPTPAPDPTLSLAQAPTPAPASPLPQPTAASQSH